MIPTPDLLRRLVLIRLLLRRAEEDSQTSSPFSTDSINRLHDAAEMFLALAVEHNGGDIPRSFISYWDELKPVLGRPLAYRAQMKRLNKVRVNLKHYGVDANPTEIQRAVASVTGLVEDECFDLLGVTLNDVSLLDVIQVEPARTLLQLAEAAWTKGHQFDAFTSLSSAFRALIDDYSERKALFPGLSIFDSAGDMFHVIPRERDWFASVDEQQFEIEVAAAINALNSNLVLVGLGIDLRRYGRYKSLTTVVVDGADVDDAGVPTSFERTADDFEYCRDFVVHVALHLAEFDYDIDPLDPKVDSVD